MSSAASSRSAIHRQIIARERMRASRGLSVTTTPSKTTTTQQSVGVAMSPPQEMRVQLLPRIAEYRSKGWITAEEESDYQQLLSSREFGDTANQVALQVQKALDLAKVKNENSSKTSTAAPNNSRSLFRKTSAGATGGGGTGGEMTLQKKLSHRRKSRMGMASPEPSGKEQQADEEKKVVMEPTELSIMEAMFGKRDAQKEEKEDEKEVTPKRNDRLARARHRRVRSNFSPDAVNSNNKATKPDSKPPVEQKESIEMTRRISNERPSVAAQKLSNFATKRLQKTGSRRSLFSQSPKSKQEGSIGEAPTISLSESSSVDHQEKVQIASRSVLQQPKTTVSQQQVLTEAPVLSSEAKLNAASNPHDQQTTSDDQQDNASVGSRSIFQQPKTTVSHSVLTEAPNTSEAEGNGISNSQERQKSLEGQQENASVGSRSIVQQPKPTSQQQVLTEAQLNKVGKSQEQQTTSGDTQQNGTKGSRSIFQQPKTTSYQQQQQVSSEAPVLSNAKLNRLSNSQNSQICEPRDLWQRNSIQSDEAVKDLFVEMAFFARLGFVQPPSCLHCTYRESIEKTSPDLGCKRYVPWRKNANIPIHPHHLDENIILVQCHTARSLVQGKTDERYRWDSIKREVIWQHPEN